MGMIGDLASNAIKATLKSDVAQKALVKEAGSQTVTAVTKEVTTAVVKDSSDIARTLMKTGTASDSVNFIDDTSAFSKGSIGSTLEKGASKSEIKSYIDGLKNLSKNEKELKLTKLAQSSNVNDRTISAFSNDTPPNILDVLSKDSDYKVKEFVAQNTSTPKDTLRNLANGINSNSFVDKKIASWALSNKNIPQDSIIKIYRDNNIDLDTKRYLLDNTSISQDILRDMRDYIAKNMENITENIVSGSGDTNLLLKELNEYTSFLNDLENKILK